jgi:hydrogenase/urease accessory protein HupE
MLFSVFIVFTLIILIFILVAVGIALTFKNKSIIQLSFLSIETTLVGGILAIKYRNDDFLISTITVALLVLGLFIVFLSFLKNKNE